MRVLLQTIFLIALSAGLSAQQPLRIIAIGAHPDDCDIKFAGTAAQFARMGHKVKFLSVTNGDAGHQTMGGGQLAMRRKAETQESARRVGIAEYEVLDNHDGELLPTVEIRKQIKHSFLTSEVGVVPYPPYRLSDAPGLPYTPTVRAVPAW